MVQNISSKQSNTFGSINKIGTTEEGRLLYEVTDDKGKVAGKISVAANQGDVFEKSYNDIMTSLPKMQEYVKNTTPQQIEKKQKQAKWITGIGAFLGGIYPLLKVKGEGVKGALKQIGLTLLGTLIGLTAGLFVASKVTTPPGASEFSKASHALSKLDIRPEK